MGEVPLYLPGEWSWRISDCPKKAPTFCGQNFKAHFAIQKTRTKDRFEKERNNSEKKNLVFFQTRYRYPFDTRTKRPIKVQFKPTLFGSDTRICSSDTLAV